MKISKYIYQKKKKKETSMFQSFIIVKNDCYEKCIFCPKKKMEKKRTTILLFLLLQSQHMFPRLFVRHLFVQISKGGHFFENKLQEISFKCKKYYLLCCMLMPMCCSKRKRVYGPKEHPELSAENVGLFGSCPSQTLFLTMKLPGKWNSELQ